MKKVLITDGSGFMGKALNQNLVKNGYEVYVFDSATGKDNFINGSVVNFNEIKSAVNGILSSNTSYNNVEL